jgi:CheY-like chemotaxis protein
MTVLVVEDDALMRMLAADIFTEAGFKVVEAGSAAEALNLLNNKEDIGLMFSDIDMGGTMDGLELAELVHLRWPLVRLLLTSGDHCPSIEALLQPGQFIRKPWKPLSLMERVEEILRA